MGDDTFNLLWGQAWAWKSYLAMHDFFSLLFEIAKKPLKKQASVCQSRWANAHIFLCCQSLT